MLKRYALRLIGRIVILLFAVVVYFYYPDLEKDLLSKNILELTILDIFWVAILMTMIVVFFKNPAISIGSLKFRKKFYKATPKNINKNLIIQEKKKQNLIALKTALVWVIFNSIFGVLFYLNIIGVKEMFILSMLYYVGDLVCVVLYCPFQRILVRCKCCSTCRIFNWSSIFMVTPLFFIPGIFSWTLCLMALIVFVIWEYNFNKYPERFLSITNEKLKCINCTDKLCKIRKQLKED